MTLDVTDLWTALDALTLVARAPNLPDRDKYEATSMRIRAEIEADIAATYGPTNAST